MSDFITDVERQYEMYCEIAEEHGFIDLNAKKNGFRCTTKSSEFNAGWIAFTGAVAAVRDEQQAIIDDLIYKAKLRESDHRALLVKYQATKKCWEGVSGKCEELKTQLKNMEACYIEKKKERDELQNRLKAVYALSRMRAAVISSWKREELSIKVRKAISHLVKKEQALRGAND